MYSDCLSIAATWGIDLKCRGCHMEHDTTGAITIDNFEFDEALRCAELLHEIFFSKKERNKSDGTEAIAV